MKCRAWVKCFGAPVALAIASYSWLGCSQSDSSGYHRISRQSSNPVTEGPGVPTLAADQATSQSVESKVNSSEMSGDREALPASTSPRTDVGGNQLHPGNTVEAEVSVSALLPVNMVDGANIRSVIGLPTNQQPDPGSKSPATDPATTTQAPAPAELRKIELLVKEKTFRTEPKTGALRVSFDDLDLLKVLNMEPVVANAEEYMPDWLQGLNGKSVRIRGYMYPTYDTEGIERFVLARDNQICCFGRDPKIYDLIQVDMKMGKSTSYIPTTRAFDVVGKFHIQMQSENGKPFGLYVIDQAEVIDR